MRPATHEPSGPLKLIISHVCQDVGVYPCDLKLDRLGRYTVAREFITALAKELIPTSFPELAGAMGKTTHSTFVHAHQRMLKKLAENKEQYRGVPVADAYSMMREVLRVRLDRQEWRQM